VGFPQTDGAPLRPLAVPLISHDTCFCVWSMAYKVTDENTKTGPGRSSHWARLFGLTAKRIA
jgi:hypothetical protein